MQETKISIFQMEESSDDLSPSSAQLCFPSSPFTEKLQNSQLQNLSGAIILLSKEERNSGARMVKELHWGLYSAVPILPIALFPGRPLGQEEPPLDKT